MNTGIANNPIRTNRLDVQLNREAFARQFDIFAVTTREKFFQHGANIFDIPLLHNRVRSICYERGNTFYILMNAHPDNKSMRNWLYCSKKNMGSAFRSAKIYPIGI